MVGSRKRPLLKEDPQFVAAMAPTKKPKIKAKTLSVPTFESTKTVEPKSVPKSAETSKAVGTSQTDSTKKRGRRRRSSLL